MFVVLFAAAGTGGWQFCLLQQTLISTQSELKTTQNTLNKITGDISAADANISQNDSAFRSELKVVNSEIRKLWDVSNKRNRAWINENKESVEAGNKKLESVRSRAERANRLVDASKKTAEQMQVKLNELNQLIKAVTTEQLVSSSDMTSNLSALKADVKKIRQLLVEQEKLQQQIKAQADLQKSFSSFRSQTNQRILQLENTVRSLANPEEETLSVQ